MLDEILYLKLCFNRAISHIGAAKAYVEMVLLMLIYAKLVGISSSGVIWSIAGICAIALILVGHLDLKHGIAAKETSLGNQYNPEIQALLAARKRKNSKRLYK